MPQKYTRLPDNLGTEQLYQEYLEVGTYALEQKYGVSRQTILNRFHKAGYGCKL